MKEVLPVNKDQNQVRKIHSITNAGELADPSYLYHNGISGTISSTSYRITRQ
jgi:hypothetical protein